MKKILITRRWPQAVEQKMKELFDVTLNDDDKPLDHADLRAALMSYEAVCPTVTDALGAEVFANLQASRCRILANFGVGYSHIDIEAARRAGIAVTNTPDVLSECTADIALTLMLMSARRASEGERELRAGNWKGWTPTHMMGQKLSGKTLGILGFGRIGQAVAHRAYHGFGMKILAFSRSKIAAEILAKTKAMQIDGLSRFLSEIDVLSIHCPGGAANRGLIGAEALREMRADAILINTARGEVVDEAALIEALKSGVIGAAGLDVYDGEPKVHPSLLACDNAVLLPHLGSATRETRDEMGFRVIENLKDFFSAQTPRDLVS